MLGIDYGRDEIITGEAAEWLYQEYTKRYKHLPPSIKNHGIGGGKSIK